IFSNYDRGIYLDAGGNAMQAAPMITALTTDATSTVVKVSVAAAPSTAYRFEAFTSPSCDPSGAGEGATFLAATSATTDAGGAAAASLSFPKRPPREAITVTATNLATGDTSAFSGCVLTR